MTASIIARRCNAAGLALIKSFESCKLTSYLCPAGVWTIGWGSTGPDIGPGMTWSQQQADARFAAEIMKTEAAVCRLVKVSVTSNQFSALVSFTYNLGPDEDADDVAEGLGDSTLLKLINAEKFLAAADEFPKWNKSKGRVLDGLTRRRKAERALFLVPDGIAEA